MDRRRFAPTTEALDARLLLSTSNRPTSVPAANLEQKTLRIERLPAYLASLQQGRTLPADTVASLQNDIRAIVGRLDRPPGGTLIAANEQFRTTISHASLSVEDAAALNATFTNVLKGANVPAPILAQFQKDMTALAQNDSNGRNPAVLAANDYALILQTTLAIGRPIRTPGAPSLASAEDTKPAGDHKTQVTRPHLIGQYDAETTVELFDQNGHLLGSATVPANGSYSIQPASPLAPGKYRLQVRATDPNGDSSALSKAFVLVILPSRRGIATSAKPGGPLSL